MLRQRKLTLSKIPPIVTYDMLGMSLEKKGKADPAEAIKPSEQEASCRIQKIMSKGALFISQRLFF